MIEQTLVRMRRKMGAKEAVERNAEVARADYKDFITVNADGSFRFDLNKAKGKTHLIKSLRHDAESGAPVIELQDVAKARELVLRMEGRLKDGPVAAAPAVVNVALILSQLPSDVLRQLAAVVSGAVKKEDE